MSLLLVLLLALILLNFCVLILMKEHKFNKGKVLMVFFLILVYSVIIIAWMIDERILVSQGIISSFIAIGIVIIAYLLYGEIDYKKGTITKSSIKESIDNLPMGLSFYTDKGIVLLSNKIMEDLCYRITGMDLQDAKGFWKTIMGDELNENVKRIVSGDNPTLRLSDGHTWTFTKGRIEVRGKSVGQITAVDTTELDTLQQRLKEDNEALVKMGNQLKLYVREVTEVKAGEERLAAKMRIHDELGYALLASKHLMEQSLDDKDEEIQKLMTLWERNIALLKGMEESEKPSALKQLKDAANAIGVKINLIGQLPGLAHIDTLILNIAGESLNNAVRHGSADELKIEVSNNKENYIVSFKNNGTLPKEPIVEGGGILALRRRVGEYNGELKLDYERQFTIKAIIPKERGGRIDSSDDCRK